MTSDRRNFLTRGAAAGLAGLAVPATAAAFGRRGGATCAPVACCPPVICCEPLHALHVFAPVPIGGPFPTILHLARCGDLLQAVITYPLGTPPPNPVPAGAAIVPHSPIFCPVGVYTSNIIPGGGHLNAFVKAAGLGTGSFTVRVCMTDGTIRDVPFAVQVNA